MASLGTENGTPVGNHWPKGTEDKSVMFPCQYNMGHLYLLTIEKPPTTILSLGIPCSVVSLAIISRTATKQLTCKNSSFQQKTNLYDQIVEHGPNMWKTI